MDHDVRWVDLSSGVRLPYVSFGPDSGVPVVFLHAWGESRGSFDRLVPLVASTIRVVAFDQRGHGEADQPTGGYSVASLAEDVVEFMDLLGLPAAVLLGSSSGGYLAQHVAVSNPQRVAGLVLIGSPLDLSERPPFADEVDRLRDPVDPGWVRESLTWFPRFHEVPQWYVEDRVRDGVHLPAHVWRATLDGLCEAIPPTHLGSITAPTLIVWGDRDELLAAEQTVALARAIPGSELVVYEDTGHLVLWEQPERIAADLGRFMSVVHVR